MVLAKATVGLVALFLALLPAWIFMLAKRFPPEGFWLNFLVFGPGFCFLAVIQFGFLAIWTLYAFSLFSEKQPR